MKHTNESAAIWRKPIMKIPSAEEDSHLRD